MPQNASTKEGDPDPYQNVPYMRDRHEDFQLAEVEEILRYPDPSKIMSEPPILPKGGEVYLYRPKEPLDRRVRDQYWWVNRGNNFHSKGQKRPSLMKTYFSLKDRNGVRKSDCLNGFRRHIYRLADAKHENDIIFIHYLGDEKLQKPMPHGNTKFFSLYSQSSRPSRESTVKTLEEVPTAFKFSAVGPHSQTNRYQNVMARNESNIGSKQSSISVNSAMTTQSNVLSTTKPEVSSLSSLSKTFRQGVDTNTRKRQISGLNSDKRDFNRTVHNSHFLGLSTKMAKTTTNSSQNGQIPLSRTGQSSVQSSSQAYVHRPISSQFASRGLKLTHPVSSINQQSRIQRTFASNRQQIKSLGNEASNLIKNQNSLQLSARTQEECQHLNNPLTMSQLPNTSQVILHDALQTEPGNQPFISQNDQAVIRSQDVSENALHCRSNYVPPNNQPPISSKTSFSNSSVTENLMSDDSTLPMDYEKFFEEASKLPKMGCDVFVLVSYPGCKPAYWGTEKYVRKFENSECLMPFSTSGCLSIQLKGMTDKQNLLANHLELSQPVYQKSEELDSSAGSSDIKLIIKKESTENNEELDTVQDSIKQECSDMRDEQVLVGNRQARIKITAQRPNNSPEFRKTVHQTNISTRENNQREPQLNTTSQYDGSNSYGFLADGTNYQSGQPSNRDKVTNFYDKVLVYKDETSDFSGGVSQSSPDTDKEHLPALRSESENVEPNQVLIKIESQTDDYGEINNLVYTEYG